MNNNEQIVPCYQCRRIGKRHGRDTSECLISAVRSMSNQNQIKSNSKSSTGPGIPDCGSRRWREPVVFSRLPWALHDVSMCALHLDMSITRRQAMPTLPGCSSCVCGTCSTCRLGPGPFPCVPSCSIMFHPHPPCQKQRSWSNLRGGPDPLASRLPKRSPGGFRWKIQGIPKVFFSGSPVAKHEIT